jgi:hypothetical protein
VITLLATLAWGQPAPDDVEPEHGSSDGGRIAVASLSGAVVGGLAGLIIGTLIGGTVNHNG